MTAAAPAASVPAAPDQTDDAVVFVTDHRVACDGGGGALGHPRVWLELGADDRAECPYCGRQFVLAETP